MRARWTGIAATFALSASLVVAAPIAPAGAIVHTDDYPTWSQVQAAKQNAAAAKAELQRIRSLVAQLQQAADAAAAAELAKAAAYAQAKTLLDAATVQADSLAAQAKTATDRAKRTRTQFGRLATQLYVSGGTEVTARLLLTTGSDSDLLDRLGAMSQLTGQVSALQTQARTEQNLARSLSAQAASAEKARARLASDAQQKLKEADAAKQQADAVLSEQQSKTVTLTAQAATLSGTSAALEKKYQEHQDYLRQQASQGGGSDVNLGGGVVVDPAAAQAYASSRLPAYGWGGDSQYECLVNLWTMESGWRADAYNTSSGAYGIPQAWPADKMASAGADWRTNAATQINWGLAYIASSYGTPCGAWSFEMSHDPHWY